MTAPRTREHANPPSPPERRPPRRGGGSSPSPYIYASAAGRPAGPARLFGARRGLGRSARALATLAMLAILGALLLPATARAQTVTTLVSNIEQDTHSFFNRSAMGQDRAQQFTTGGNAGGYNLDSIELKVTSYENAVVTVSLHAESSGNPESTSLFTFTNPTAGVVADSDNTFTAPDNTTLMASTAYYIVVGGADDPDETSNSFSLATASSGDEDEGGAVNSEGTADWEISNNNLSLLTGTGWETSSRPHMIRINGTAAGGGTPTLSTDATLSGGTVTAGSTTLVTFASGTYTYTASVANGVEEVTVAPVTNHASATVGYLLGDAGDEDDLEDADAMEDDFQVALAVGANRIVVSVTAEDGTTYLDYVVTVTRAAAAMTPTCTLNAGDLWCGVLTIGTAVAPGATSYGYVPLGIAGLLLPNSFTHEGTPITFELVAHQVYAVNPPILEVLTSPALPLGYNFVLQAGSQSYSFAGGETDYFFDPPGVDWSMSDGQTVTLRLRETPSEHATLSGLAVNDGSSDLTLSPAFAPDNTSYTAGVPNAVDEVTVTPTPLNSNATIAWMDGSGMALADADAAAGQQVALSEGENVIKVQVTSQDGTAMVTYTVTVTRQPPPPATPTGLSATAGNGRVSLSWTAPAPGADITHHEYRYKTDSDYQDNWNAISYSAPGGFNEDGFTVTGLDNDTAHTFQLRAVNSGGESGSVESSAVTPSGNGRTVNSIGLRRYDDQDGEPYGIGDRIVFVVKFSGEVKCTNHQDGQQVAFDIGENRRKATRYTTGDGQKSFWYEYTVQAGDIDSDGIEIPAGSTALIEIYYSTSSCGSPFDKSGITAQGPFPDRKVDGVYPSLDSAVVNGTILVLTWDETLRDDSVPAATDFAVTVAGSARSVTGLVFADGVVSLVLASAVRAGETVTVSYTKGTNTLKDLGSNEAPALTDQAVTNSTAPPDAPTDFTAAVGDAQVTLSWDKPESASGVTKHQYQFKTGDGAYGGWQDIANSGVGGANEKSFTKTGLTNEVAHTFQLRAVNAAGDSDAVESDPVTPTPGICGRTAQVQTAIIYYLDADVGVTRTCAAVNVADLASLTLSMEMQGEGITSLRPGDFAGLTSLQTLDLSSNSFTTLPAGVFSGMTALTTIKLKGGALTSLPANVFSGLPALEILELENNSNLTSLDADVFDGLTALITLWLHENDLASLDADVFDGLTALETIVLRDNDLTSLDARQFSGLTALVHLELAGNDLASLAAGTFDSLTSLTTLTLNGNDLTSLPDGAFSGLTALTTLPLGDNPNTDDDLPLTVTVEKVGTDQARAKVRAGAPFAVEFTPTVVNGSLPASDTKLAVTAGAVDGTAVTVTRTSGTMAAVTVDIDLSTQPTLPTNHTGYTFAKAASGLPAEILPDTRGPQNFTAKPGDGQAVLAWDAPPSGSGVTKHQYHFKTTGSYPATWTDVPNSAEDGDNEDGYTVPNLTNETAHTFELRWLVGTTGSATAESNTVTPTPGICDRTQQVRDGIVTAVSGADACNEVTVADLAGIGRLNLDDKSIRQLKEGDFAGLTGMTILDLSGNRLSALPAGVFSGLTGLTQINLSFNDLTSVPDGLFLGLTGLTLLNLDANPETGDRMPLTVTLEKVGDDRVRAKVLAAAPFAVDFTVAPANGTLAGGATVLRVPAGSVDGTPVTVTRTEGTTDAVTVDIDLSTQPSVPANHTRLGYEFARSSDLPVEILEEEASLDPPTGLMATAGDRQAGLTWTPPAADSGYTRHEYRYEAGNGRFGDWTDIPDSGPGEANGSRYTVTALRNGRAHVFELRARDAGAGKSDEASVTVEPTGPPRIVSVAVVSGPGLDDGQTYGEGEEIRIEVTFDQEVAVTGDPEIAIEVGDESPRAQYDSGGGTDTLVFVYVVREDDEDADGVTVGADALRLDAGDGIRNPSGDDADRTHDGPGTLSGHRVDGSRRGDVHEHGEFTHGHSVFNDGKGYYTETYPEHTHEGHEHSNTANGHTHPRPGHTHHADENPNADISDGPDEVSHDGVLHIHRCYDLKSSCNQGDEDKYRGDELGLPIEVRHSHATNSEPGHGFDWDEWFAGRGDDATGATVSVADAEAVGGEDEHLRFAVTLEPAQAFAVRVDYATADGTAAAGEDYAETRGVLEIPPGETRATVRVPVRDRAPDDGEATMTLTLGPATAARVADGEATGTILAPEATTTPEIDDIDVVSTPRLWSRGAREPDTYGEGETIRIEVEFDQPVVVEGDPVLELEVCDRGESLCEVEARYESGSGTDTLVFAYPVFEWDIDRNGIALPADPIGESIDDFDGFSIRNDAGQEADLSYRREGTKSGHRVDGTRQAAQHLSVEDAEAREADGEMTFTVRLEPRGLGLVTVEYATRDGSGNKGAVAGEDYTETRGTLTFNPLERERTVSVPIIDDAEPDDGETFTLVLSNASGARIADARATGTIRNTEEEPEEEEPEVEEPEEEPEVEEEEPENTPAQGTPTIAGTARVGDTLTASTSDITDADGLATAEFAYQWIRGSTDIPGARGRTYTAAEADEGKRLKVRVGFTDDAGNEESLTSAATDAVAARPQPEISVADARADEGAGATLDFEVTLSAPAPGPVTVDYRTLDASAKAGADYAARQGTLTFRAGETMKTVSVPVLDDAHDEGREILVLTLDNARGGVLADRIGVGTIENADPLQRAWLSRFGRMAALQVVDHVEARMAARREPGFRGRFAGRELRRGMERDIALSFLQRLGRTAAPGPIGGVAASMSGVDGSTGSDNPTGGMAAPMGMSSGRPGGGSPHGVVGLDWGRLLRTGLGGGDLLTGSDFALDRLTDRGGIVSFWSRGSMSRFSGREGALSLGGDVRTTMFGADYAQGPLTAGLMLSHSRGLGEYAGVDGGVLHSSVTGLFPWLGYRAAGRVSAWAVTGYGSGGLMLTPDGVGALESGLSMAMAAVGARGALAGVAAASGGTGFGLSFKADALWVGTSIEGVDGAAGSLKATASSATRVRAALEASSGFIIGGLSLRPSVEAGLRHDGGDAETGSGLDLGGGLAASVSSTGLTVEVRLRTLLAHEAEGYSERGASVQLSWNPSPSTPLGFNARLSPSWGVRATGGAEALWGRETMAGVGARNGPAAGNRLDAEAGYGLPLGGGFVGTPRVGVRTSESGRDYLLGWSVGVLGGGALNLSLGVDAHRRESPRAGGAAHGVAGRVGVRW